MTDGTAGPGELTLPGPVKYLDKNVLRNQVSLAGVAAELGVLVDESGYARCPFHDDEKPSFHVFFDGSGVERWSCYPCGMRGDVYDLVRQVEGLSFTSALERVDALKGILPPPPQRELKHDFDRDACAALVDQCRQRAQSHDGWMCVVAGLRDDPSAWSDAHLREHWRWGVTDDGALCFPHYDTFGSLVGAKFRGLDGLKWSFPGSAFHALYGAWRQRQHRSVVLCEGETDSAWASLQLPQADVLGLPAGAGKWLNVWGALEADTYWLAFDADGPGREATSRWQAALLGQDVRVIHLEEGQDLKGARKDITGGDLVPALLPTYQA